MTEKELKQIQAVCHEWLRKPGTANESRMTIPAGGSFSRTIDLEIRALLTFDNVLVRSVVDSETGVCYSKLIGSPGEPGKFIDNPLDQIASSPTPREEPREGPPAPPAPLPLRATQQRYQDAMERLTKTQPVTANADLPSVSETSAGWIDKGNFEADQEPQPRYLLYTGGVLLGYSLLEHTRSDGQRRGRFHAGEDYFEYSNLFESLTETENECLEANVQEAYGIPAPGSNELRKRLTELSAQANALKLHVESEDGLRLEAAEVTLEDLSRYYNDESERWLCLALAKH